MDTLTHYQITLNNVKPNFSYRLHNIHTSTIYISQPTINFKLNETAKMSTPTAVFTITFNQLINETYRDYIHIYTDGSKSQRGVGAAFVKGNLVRRASLPKEACIYSAELHAIQMTIADITNDNHNKFVIFSDSYSALRSLDNKYTRHPIARKLLHSFHDLKTRGKTVELCWVPSHVGIREN